MNYSDATSLIIVEHFGKDFKHVLPEIIESLERRDNLATIYLDLPLENPAGPIHYNIIEKQGFIYSGLAPDFHKNADFLRLQKTYIDLDFDLIEVISEHGKKIKMLIADEYHQQ